MKNDELLKLDFQLLTIIALINNTASLTTILENQTEILSILKNVPQSQISDEVNKKMIENIQRVNEKFKKKTPKYPFDRDINRINE
jgi:hypothetical protein